MKNKTTKRKSAKLNSKTLPTPEHMTPEVFDSVCKAAFRKPTLYDKRLELLADIAASVCLCDHLDERFTAAKLELASARNELRDVNREIRSELTLDQTV
jgi:hypothetical protein